MPTPADVDNLLQDLRNPDPRSRQTANEALGQMPPGDERVTAALSAAADNDDDREVRSAASGSFTALKGLNAQPKTARTV